MGSYVSLFWRSSNDDTVDPATGLTNKQKKIVGDTWALVKKDTIPNGIAVMQTFLKKYPEYQKLFQAFKDIPLDELPANKRFQAHCLSIMTTLNDVISVINDPALLEATLLGISERHHKRGQTKDQFLQLKNVILDVFRQKFGKKFTDETEEAWSKTIDAMYGIMFQVYSL